MWRIYLLFSLLLTIYIGLVILAYGIKTTVRIDVNNLSLCVKIFIFDWIEVFCFKIFVSEQQFYYQINKKDIKLFERKGQDRKSKKKSRKIRIFSYLYYAIEKAPKIIVYNPVIKYGAEFEEIKNKALFDGGVSAAVYTAVGVLYDKLELKNLSLQNIGDESSFKGVYLEGALKFSLLKIFFYFLHIISVKRRFQTA